MAPHGGDFSLEFSRARGAVIVHVRGALDFGTAHVLKDRLVDVIDGQGNRQLVLELEDMASIDAAGGAVIADALHRLQRRGGELVLSGPTSRVATVLRNAGLDEVSVITPTWDHPAHGRVHTSRGRPGWRRSG